MRWVEQPLPPDDLAGHRRLRQAVSVPIGTGEDEWGPESYRHVIASDGVDVLQVDPGRALGISGCRDVMKMAAAASLTVSAHSWSSALNTAASLHLLASSVAGDTLDFKPHESPMQHDLVDHPWTPSTDGLLTVPDRPGLGVSVAMDAVRRYEMRDDT